MAGACPVGGFPRSPTAVGRPCWWPGALRCESSARSLQGDASGSRRGRRASVTKARSGSGVTSWSRGRAARAGRWRCRCAHQQQDSSSVGRVGCWRSSGSDDVRADGPGPDAMPGQRRRVQPPVAVVEGGQVREVLEHEHTDAQQRGVRRPGVVVEVVDVDRVDPDQCRAAGGQPGGAVTAEIRGPARRRPGSPSARRPRCAGAPRRRGAGGRRWPA